MGILNRIALGESSLTLFYLTLSYLLEPVKFFTLVLVEFGDDVRESAFQPRYNDVSESVHATIGLSDYLIQDLEVALQRRKLDQQLDCFPVILL